MSTRTLSLTAPLSLLNLLHPDGSPSASLVLGGNPAMLQSVVGGQSAPAQLAERHAKLFEFAQRVDAWLRAAP